MKPFLTTLKQVEDWVQQKTPVLEGRAPPQTVRDGTKIVEFLLGLRTPCWRRRVPNCGYVEFGIQKLMKNPTFSTCIEATSHINFIAT